MQDLDLIEALREEKLQRQELIKENCLEKVEIEHVQNLLFHKRFEPLD